MKITVDDNLNLVIDTGGLEHYKCVIKCGDNNLYPLEFSKPLVVDKETITINNIKYRLDCIELLTKDFVNSEYMNSEPVYLKSYDETTLPDESKFPLIYAVAIRAMKHANKIPLTQTQHNKKLAAIRELNKIATGVKTSMSIPKLETLLGYYGLTISDLIKDEYL